MPEFLRQANAGFLRQELAQMEDRQDRLADDMEAIATVVEAENRSGLNSAEQRRFDALLREAKSLKIEIRDARQGLRDAEDAERRSGLAARAAGQTGQLGDQRGGGDGARFYAGHEEVYSRGSGRSYFADLVRAKMDPSPDVSQRLAQHAQEMDRRLAGRDADREMRGWAPPRELRVAPNRVDGQGGNFVPPAWLIEQYVTLARFGRTTADLTHKEVLPAGTDSINVPKISTGTATAMQTADGAPVQSTDLTDAFLNAPVRTLAGQQDVALQLLDQSPVSFDEIVFKDLIADYNQKLDVQAISGSGAAGQMTGILTLGGTNSVVYTTGSPTLGGLLVPLTQASSKVATVGKAGSPEGVVVHPAIWNWAISQLDSQGRPLMNASTAGPMNVIGTSVPVGAMEGAVGTLGGLPAYLDGNLPTNLGAGTNETRFITARFSEMLLWESVLRTRVLMEILSGTLQVRLQVYAYVAFMPDRRPTATSVISGTGCILPSGY